MLEYLLSAYPPMTTRPPSRRTFLRTGLAAIAAPALSACDFFGFKEGGNARLAARPGEPTWTPATGLSSLALAADRDALLFIPSSYDPAVPMPLVVALHGAGGNAGYWASYHDRAETRGFILLAPESFDFTWDLVLGDFGVDVTFVDQALAATFDRCRIAASRIALAGFSDGASYALSLGIPNGDLFTHLIAYSPGYYTRTSAEGRPRILVSHGRSDTVLPVAGSRDVIVPHLTDRGYDVTYEEFDGGHEVPAAMSEAALDWFLGAT